MDIADYLTKELSRHIVAITIKSRLQPGKSLDSFDVELLFSEIYASTHNLETLHAYIDRLLPWLEFSGLIEIDDAGNVIRPEIEGKGMGKGKVIKRRSSLNEGQRLFVCSASPRRVVELAVYLCLKKVLTRFEVESSSNRNAALDLNALGLAYWSKSKLYPTERLQSVEIGSDLGMRMRFHTLIKDAAMESKFLSLLKSELELRSQSSYYDIYTSMVQKLNRDWQPDSAARYINAGKSWLSYFGYFLEISGQMKMFDLSD